MRKFFLFFAAALVALAVNAKETAVSAGESTLSAAIAAADAGDVLVLDTGTYSEPEQIVFDKDITIQAPKGATLAQHWWTYLQNGANVTIQGIKFDGAAYPAADHGFRTYDESNGNETLTLIDCEVCNYTNGYFIYPQKPARRMKACTIRGTYCHDNSRAIVYNESGGSDPLPLAELTIENSTIAGSSADKAIYVKNGGTAVKDAKIRIDHCTFFNCGPVRSEKSTDVVITNSIFAAPEGATYAASVLYEGVEIDHCLSFNVNHQDGPTITNPVEGDPKFTDAENGDLTLEAGSAALGAGTEGSDLGDPRWVPVAPVEPIVLYLKAGPWYYAGNNEKFAIYAWADGKEAVWSEFMELAENETAIWTGTIPGDLDNVIFVRFGNAATTPSWEDNMWNQTEDLKIEEGKDLYTITKQEPYDEEQHKSYKAEGEWSKYEYVAPAKFYVLGLDNKWTEADVVRSDSDTYVTELEAGYYEFKVLVEGTWATEKGFDDLTLVPEGVTKNETYGNICFTLAEAGEVKITYTSSVFTLEGNFYVEPGKRLEDGFYLIGSFNGVDAWNVEDITAEKQFTWNKTIGEGNEEWMITIDLTEGDEFKAVYVYDDAITSYIPDGTDNNYVVDKDHAGEGKTIYFQQLWNEEWGGHFFVEANATGVEETNATVKAVKSIENGQLVIIKNGVRFNILGTEL